MSDAPESPIDENSILLCEPWRFEALSLVPAGVSDAPEIFLRSEAKGSAAALERYRAIFDLLPARIALVNREGEIVATNRSWRRPAAADAAGLPDREIGANFLSASDPATGEYADETRAMGDGLREVLDGVRARFSLRYAGHSQNRRRWHQVDIFPCGEGAAVMHADITARVRNEEDGRENEELFSATFSHAPVGIGQVSLEGRWQRVNEKLCEITGWSREELLEKNFQELTHPDDLARSLQTRDEMLSGACETRALEKRYIKRSGEDIWVRMTVALSREPDGTPKHFVVVVDDITTRKEAEMRLARVGRLYSVLGKINEAIVRTRTPRELFERVCRIAVENGNLLMTCVIQLDPATSEARPVASFGADHGYSASLKVSLGRGVIGASIRSGGHDVCNDIAKDPRMAPWRDAALDRGYRSTAAFAIQLGGKIFGTLVYFAGQVDYFHDEEIRLMLSISADISFALASMEAAKEKRRAQDALRASEQQFASAFEYASIGMGLVATDGRWLHVNRALCHMLGYSEKEMLTTTFQDITHPEDLEADLLYVRQMMAGLIQTYNMEKRYLDAEGNIVWVLLSVSLARDAQGEPLHFISQIQDIRERKEAESRVSRQLQELERWRAATLGREERIQVLKREINDLLAQGGKPPRYTSQAARAAAGHRESPSTSV